jgi:hypothetical protein
MIKTDEGVTTIEGELNIVMADYAVIKRAVEEILKDNNCNVNETFEKLEQAKQYGILMESGMSIRDAMEIVSPTATEEQLSMMEKKDAEYKNKDKKKKEKA